MEEERGRQTGKEPPGPPKEKHVLDASSSPWPQFAPQEAGLELVQSTHPLPFSSDHGHQVDVKQLATDWHFDFIEGVLQDVVSVLLVHLVKLVLHACHRGLHSHEELGPSDGLKAVQVKCLGF
eukprot:TRINITY_DN1775_c0_g1_i1.p3 TRINITY_DN1775_c0_g1~~TRINITY_DN1775_c0_g1_i1.p3  ORF type:complete len:123 (-),score=14.80 TRINITY_DN1775_c0_g1_i1:281-649(-)